jgi:hypothetical protein
MINRKLLALLILPFFCSCDQNFYGDIDLGSDFYYLVEPSFNQVAIPVNREKPYQSSITIIKNIKEIGFNRDFILVKSIVGDSIKYWIIDKSKKSKELGYIDNSVMRLTNVNQVDSILFNWTKKKLDIQVREKDYYQKELGYKQ